MVRARSCSAGAASHSAAAELGDDEKLRLLRASLKRWKAEVGIFFEGVGPDARTRSCGASRLATWSFGCALVSRLAGEDGLASSLHGAARRTLVRRGTGMSCPVDSGMRVVRDNAPFALAEAIPIGGKV